MVPSQAFTVRPATLRDLPALRLLWTHLWDAVEESGAPVTFDADDLDRMTVDLAHALVTPEFVVFLALDTADNAPLGMLVGEIQTRRYGSPKRHAYVAAVWVEPAQRHSGISVQFGIDFLAWCRQFDGVEHGEYVTVPGMDTPLQWWKDAFGCRQIEARYSAPFTAVDAVVNAPQPSNPATNPEEAA